VWGKGVCADGGVDGGELRGRKGGVCLWGEEGLAGGGVDGGELREREGGVGLWRGRVAVVCGEMG